MANLIHTGAAAKREILNIFFKKLELAGLGTDRLVKECASHTEAIKA